MDAIRERMDIETERWEWLRTFGTIVRVGSFTGAARFLGMSQSSVSRHVALLEARAGQPLFTRRGRSVELTNAGRALAKPSASVEAAMASFDRTLSTLPGLAFGEVHVSSAPELVSMLLAPRAPALLAAHPEVRLSLSGRTEVESLMLGETEIALRVVAPVDASLVRKRVGVLRYRWYRSRRAPASNPHVVGYATALSMLPEAKWIEAHVDPSRIAIRSNLPAAVAAACASGPFASVLADPLASTHPTLVPEGPVLFERPLYTVVHREIARVPRIRLVTRWIAECASTLGTAR